MATLPETNSKFTPKHRPKPNKKGESIPTIHFQGLWLLVSGRVIGALGRLVVWDSNRVPLSNSPFHFRGSEESCKSPDQQTLGKTDKSQRLKVFWLLVGH